jgi:hypothetical protein
VSRLYPADLAAPKPRAKKKVRAPVLRLPQPCAPGADARCRAQAPVSEDRAGWIMSGLDPAVRRSMSDPTSLATSGGRPATAAVGIRYGRAGAMRRS